MPKLANLGDRELHLLIMIRNQVFSSTSTFCVLQEDTNVPPCTQKKMKIIKEPNDQIIYWPDRTGKARPFQ